MDRESCLVIEDLVIEGINPPQKHPTLFCQAPFKSAICPNPLFTQTPSQHIGFS